MEELPEIEDMEVDLPAAEPELEEEEQVDVEKAAYDAWKGCKCSRKCKEVI